MRRHWNLSGYLQDHQQKIAREQSSILCPTLELILGAGISNILPVQDSRPASRPYLTPILSLIPTAVQLPSLI